MNDDPVNVDNIRWPAFEQLAPRFAGAGRRILTPVDVPIGMLATVNEHGVPHLAPICPIFTAEGLYLSASGASPKVQDLAVTGRYVLHAFLGDDDEEWQVAGLVRAVVADEERHTVHAAIAFPAFERADPVFELLIHRCLWVYWERVGQPDTRAVRQRWSTDDTDRER